MPTLPPILIQAPSLGILNKAQNHEHFTSTPDRAAVGYNLRHETKRLIFLQEMIYNRTEEDVRNAKTIIMEKVQKKEELTESDIAILERGTLTINTLNRIENKQSELKSRFDSFFYFFGVVETKDWESDDIFKLSDLQRLISNNSVLRSAFYVLTGTPEDPSPRYHYENINDLEKILVDLEYNLDYMISHFRQCGATQCGE